MSFPCYESYKDSGIEWLGEVPVHWELKRVKQVFSERDERSGDGSETLLSVSAYTGVSPRSEIIDEGDHLSRAESLEGYKVCYPNDLVMNIMLAWNRGLGFTRYVGIVSPAYSVFRVVDGSFPAFLNYLVRSDKSILYFKAFSAGVIDSRLRLYPDVFSRLYIALPSVEEQQSIAAFLDRETAKIDALIAEQQRLIELLKEKRQAVISHAVTKWLNPEVPMKDSGIEWLGEVPAHWAIATLSYRYDVALGKMLDEKRITGKHLAPYLRNVDVQWGKINTVDLPEMDFKENDLERYSLLAGDLLVCEGGEVGRAAIWNGELEECYYQKALHRLRPKSPASDIPKFMFYHLWAAAFSGRFVGSEGRATIVHLTAEALRRYQFAFPPYQEQSAIVNFLDRETITLDALTVEAQRAIDLLKERRAALISAAVTGKIDVRGLLPS